MILYAFVYYIKWGEVMIGKKLSSLRYQHGISQRELASQLHISIRTLKNWEGDFSNPSLVCLRRIALFFHVSSDELLGINKVDYIDLSPFDMRDRIRIKRALQGFLDT